jgi:formylglycine-generating enzyme
MKTTVRRLIPFILLGGLSPAWADEVTNSLGMKLVRIEPGKFVMGQDGPPADYRMNKHPAKFDDADWDERPAHRVTITKPFHIGATEVTVAQYRQFKPDHRATKDNAEDAAVTHVSWDDAVKFCEWLSAKEKQPYRLPTEAEWEYSCRAGTATLFSTGDALPAGFHQGFSDAGFRERYFPKGQPLPPEYRDVNLRTSLRVAQTPSNAWGLFDMHGNVAEWCLDWYGPYEAGEQADPIGRSAGDFRVFRGGHYATFTRYLRSANRAGWLPEAISDKTGFRVLLADPPSGQGLPAADPPLNQKDVSQAVAKMAMASPDLPFFTGPVPYVKIPEKSSGPLFSVHNHSPSITECPNSDLLAVWYSCADEGGAELCNLASRLRRGAGEWEPASPFWDGPDINDHAPKVWWDGEQTLYHFARGNLENIVRTSKDNGATWSKAKVIQPAGEIGNAFIKTREGYILATHDSGSTSLIISWDGGKSWTYPVIADRTKATRTGSGLRHVGIHAPIVQLGDGCLMAFSRNDAPEMQEKFHFKTPISYSNDWGVTWTYEESVFPAISTVQRQVLMRLREGPLLFCSYTDQLRNSKNRKGISFVSHEGGEYTGYGLFAAVSYDDGKTWPERKLITPGGKARTVNGIDRTEFTLSDTLAEPQGYLAATQTRDGRIQLISSKNHYVFNLAWLKTSASISNP